MQYSKIKSNYVLKNAGNWTGFTLQTIYLVDILLFLHGVFVIMYIALQFGMSFEPKCPKTSFLAPDPKVKVFFII